jgi:hypothetical protein
VADFDLFANQLLEEAKRFLEKGKESSDAAAEAANLHAALLLSFCALEAHVNSIGEEFSIAASLSAHEKGLLLEKDVRLEDGEFRLQPGLRMAKLEDRIELLHARFSGKHVDRSSVWWGQLTTAIDLRNKLTHAKTVTPITRSAVSSAIQAIIDALDTMYQAIYKRKFPAATQGLQSSLTF